MEDNNGWTKIENVADLHSIVNGRLYHIIKNGKLAVVDFHKTINYEKLFDEFKEDGITHFQQIEKPKPPNY